MTLALTLLFTVTLFVKLHKEPQPARVKARKQRRR
jgi:hypothetical protein